MPSPSLEKESLNRMRRVGESLRMMIQLGDFVPESPERA